MQNLCQEAHCFGKVCNFMQIEKKILFFVAVCWQMRLLVLATVQLCLYCFWGRIKCSSSYPYIFDEMHVEVCQECLSIALFRED